MDFWDRIKRWLKGSTTTDAGRVSSVRPTKPLPGTTLENLPPDGSLPSPGNAAVDIFRLLFSNKNKHITTMLNSISLSSDMKTLYLIDNGRAIPYDLTVRQGVLVGLLGDQLVVATATTVPVPSDTPDPPGPAVETTGAVETPEVERTRPVEKKYTFKAGENSQYTLSYNGKNKALGIIGVDDVVIHLEAPESGNCSEKIFDLSHKNIVRIRWTAEELELVEVR